MRVLRMLRLFRMVRLLRLVPELVTLLSGMSSGGVRAEPEASQH